LGRKIFLFSWGRVGKVFQNGMAFFKVGNSLLGINPSESEQLVIKNPGHYLSFIAAGGRFSLILIILPKKRALGTKKMWHSFSSPGF
jgi:hypothetical protein